VQFFTATGQQRVMGAFVVVVGLGVRTPPDLILLRALAPPAAQPLRTLLLLLCPTHDLCLANVRQGVGSHAAHMLLRSGVGRLRLIDFDQVSLSSLNRHATATRQDVGLPKATCLQVPPCCARCAPCTPPESRTRQRPVGGAAG